MPAVAAKEFQPQILDFVNARTLSNAVIRLYDDAGNVNQNARARGRVQRMALGATLPRLECCSGQDLTVDQDVNAIGAKPGLQEAVDPLEYFRGIDTKGVSHACTIDVRDVRVDAQHDIGIAK
ncbi:MAG: hypothetical protein Udaeo2_25050 [Candidatus Udaeobacter sp.]|nr:MAG: hypothetical protein Udaeo2_25050 [Candidatus Udaeobacter sp.]